MMERIRIKICGLTSIADCHAVNRALPDYAGFVMTDSKRQVSPSRAAYLIEHLDKAVKPIGVFTNESTPFILDAVSAAKLAGVQLHGRIVTGKIITLRHLLPRGTVIWQRLPVSLEQPEQLSFLQIQEDIDRLEVSLHQPDVWLLDSCGQGRIGGTGESFDWTAFSGLRHKLPLAVAGGLNRDNVGRAIQSLLPCMVDCSSGVETGGSKDTEKIVSFCHTVRDKVKGV